MALQFSLTQDAPAAVQTDCLIVGLFANATLCPIGTIIDKACDGALSALVASNDISGKSGRTTWLYHLKHINAKRILVVGLGAHDKWDQGAYQKAISHAVTAVGLSGAQSAVLALSAVPVAGRDAAWAIRQAVTSADHAAYRYTATLGDSAATEASHLRHVSIIGTDSTALMQGCAIAKGAEFARELGNLPANICTPAYLAEQAIAFAQAHPGVEVEILDETQMAALGMGALLAVARGSANRPRFIILSWKVGGEAAPYVLVGKGITFDTGGVNLKTQGGIEEMKFDMCGGATVMGTFVAAVTATLPLNVITIIPAVENAIYGNSYRPSDVIKSLSGKTIEVGNTDAEGRLILCDALSYATRYQPTALIDVATLTGACMVALGTQAAGLMSHHDDLANELLDAGKLVHDRAWRMPLWDEYQESLDSIFADVYNIGGRYGGSITAACFLSRFTEGQRWAHLDIAGVASDAGKRGMATGRPVYLLSQWLLTCANQ